MMTTKAAAQRKRKKVKKIGGVSTRANAEIGKVAPQINAALIAAARSFRFIVMGAP